MDAHAQKGLSRALARHGKVFPVAGINDALFLMAEQDIDYYFIDADVPDARAFLMHIQHDPQLLPPRGLVLLTENEEEDCEAWGVDAFLSRQSAVEDLPYIFSHLKGTTPEPAKLIRLAPLEDKEPAQPAPRTSIDPSFGQAKQEHEIDAREHLRSRRVSEQVKEEAALAPGADWEKQKQTGVSKQMRLAFAAVLVAAALAWLFVWGPLSHHVSTDVGKPTSKKRVSAKSAGPASSVLESSSTASSSTVLSSPQTVPVQTSVTAPGATEAEAEQKPAESQSPEPVPVPAPPPVNHPPTVSISGPTQVVHGQTAGYSASAADPDGDSVSLTWTSRSMSWSTPGLYSLSVTATDGKGASAADTISVRVI